MMFGFQQIFPELFLQSLVDGLEMRVALSTMQWLKLKKLLVIQPLI